jgi:hypothetical protein
MDTNIFRIFEDKNLEISNIQNFNVDNNNYNNPIKKRRIEVYNSISSITRCLTQCDEDLINENEDYNLMREEYLKIMQENTVKDSMNIITKIYKTAIDNSKVMLNVENNECKDYLISIKEHGVQKDYIIKNDQFIIIGKINGCNFQSKNPFVSRVHIVILNFMNYIYLFDSYSLNGIEILNRSNESIDNINNIKRQSIIKFNKNEIGTLQIGYSTEIYFTQK